MTTGTGHSRVLTGKWECGVVVIERRRNPRGGVMAHLALLREPGLDVVGTRRSGEIV